MTISYVQAFPPKWYIVGLDGLAAGGAQLFTYDSITRQPKFAYQDPGGNLAYTNPIIFDLNGTRGPIYWKLDSAAPTDLYYIEAYDKDGNFLWDADNFPSSAGGGGGSTTTFISLNNYITNNQFINNIGDQAGPLPTNLVIAPSNHKGFTPALINPVVGTYGVLGPDIRFVKNNTNATDSLSFPRFALSSAPLTGDVTPVEYIRYVCTNSPAGETYKSFQFPITQKVKNLSNQAMTFGVWAAVTASAVNVNVYTRQYYGSGTGATPESGSTRVLVGTLALTTTWTWFPFNFTVPSVSGNSLGTPGLQTNDDALYIQIEMPLGAPCDVLFTKPALYLGTVDPDVEFDSYDQIDSIDQTPRTGDVKPGYLASPPGGWLAMNDTSIGNVGSAATTAGERTFQLYKTLWDAVINTWAPVSGGRGASAIDDFLAGKTLTMPRALGRALAEGGTGAGLTGRDLGQWSGAETSTILSANLPSTCPVNPGGTGNTIIDPGTSVNVPGHIGTGYAAGGDTPLSIMQPTTFMLFYIKL